MVNLIEMNLIEDVVKIEINGRFETLHWMRFCHRGSESWSFWAEAFRLDEVCNINKYFDSYRLRLKGGLG